MAKRFTYRGTNGDDTQVGTYVADRMYGRGGRDILSGGDGNDRLFGGAGDDTLDGGDGDDRLSGGAGNDELVGGLGNNLIDGGAGQDVLFGGDGDDRLRGGGGDDLFWGLRGADAMIGGRGFDTVSYTESRSAMIVNLARGDADDGIERDTLKSIERVWGSAQGDTLIAGAAAATLQGIGGNDVLTGGRGGDVLEGGAGDDRLEGGFGYDRLTGGTGADLFVFNDDTDVGKYARATDVITDFSQAEGDRIDLGAIDADDLASGDQAFTFIGTAAFSGTAGELRFEIRDGRTLIAGDVDGDGKANGYIALDGAIALTAADFVL